MENFRTGDYVRVFDRYRFASWPARGIVTEITETGDLCVLFTPFPNHYCIKQVGTSYFLPEQCRHCNHTGEVMTDLEYEAMQDAMERNKVAKENEVWRILRELQNVLKQIG